METPESDILIEFMDILHDKKYSEHGTDTVTWIGHYVTGFDLRFLWQRYVANGISPLVDIPIDAKPWETEKVFDTMLQWTGVKKSGVGSLDAICRALGNKGKDGMDGSMVWDYAKAGRFDEIIEYCKDDVERTRFLYKKLTFQ